MNSASKMPELHTIDKILEERGSNYGDFATHARITQNIKIAMQDGAAWKRMTAEQRESLEMIAHKLGRICNGNPNYKDSWTDIIGYAKLVEQDLPAPPVG